MWSDRVSVRKGTFGEAIVDRYLKSKGLVPYRPDADRPHPFDRLCASADKRSIFVVEVKAKGSRIKYPDTGIDERHFHDYVNIAVRYGLNVYIYFVDDRRREIYGGQLFDTGQGGTFLLQDRSVLHQGRQLLYPRTETTRAGHMIKYFPLEAMEVIHRLTDEEVAALRAMTRGVGAENYRQRSLL